MRPELKKFIEQVEEAKKTLSSKTFNWDEASEAVTEAVIVVSDVPLHDDVDLEAIEPKNALLEDVAIRLAAEFVARISEDKDDEEIVDNVKVFLDHLTEALEAVVPISVSEPEVLNA